jgi:SNF2 family DNA or RNA helicase
MNSLNRIKDHLTEGECPICSQELKDDCEGKVVIFKCCSVIICEICCFGTIFKKTHVGTCGNCRKECTLKDLIYINQEINLDELVQKVESGSFHKEVKEAAETATPVQVNSGRSQNYCKFDAIVDIIRGITPLNQKRVNMIIPQLMAGSSELPESNTRKVLIFANYDETLHRICDRLTDEKIDYERLGGTHKQIAEMVNRFQTSLNHNVLVICAAKYCAGLNLQMATDLIFAHLMVDENIETQVAGRLIRLGRQNAANFHYLMYESEYRAKIRLGRMQELE